MSSLDSPSLAVSIDSRSSGKERLAVWTDLMSTSGTIKIDDPDHFMGSCYSRTLGELRTMRIVASTFSLARDRAMASLIPRQHILINHVAAGRISGNLANRKISIERGDLLVSRLHNGLDLLLEEADWFALMIPRSVVERHMPWPTKLDGQVFPAGTVTAALIGDLMKSLHALPENLKRAEVSRAVTASLASVMTCFGGPMLPVREKSTKKDALSTSIRHFIIQNLPNPGLTTEMIAQEFGISRSGLYLVMRDVGDIATIVRRLRLQAISKDIVSGQHDHLSLAAIAGKWGFADERSFRRAFVREFGEPPSALRREAGKADGAATRELYRWFMGM